MFSSIVSDHDHLQSTGNDSLGVHPSSATNPLRHVKKPNKLLRHIYAQQFVARNFANNRENFKRELCLNIIILFSIIVGCLVVT